MMECSSTYVAVTLRHRALLDPNFEVTLPLVVHLVRLQRVFANPPLHFAVNTVDT